MEWRSRRLRQCLQYRKMDDDTCSEKFPFVCRHPRPRSNCIDIPELEKTQCGYPGISESVCMQDLKCCYSGADIAGISCYNPKGRKSGGMSPGGAAALTSFIWIVRTCRPWLKARHLSTLLE